VDKRQKVQELRKELSRMHGQLLSRGELVRCEAIREISLVSTEEEIDAIYFAGDTDKRNWEKTLKEVFQRLNLPRSVSVDDRIKILQLALAMIKEGATFEEGDLETIELGVGDWLKKIAAKAASLIKSVWKKITGALKPRMVTTTTFNTTLLAPGFPTESFTISKGGLLERTKGGPDVIIDSLGREWRRQDHPRNPDGTFKYKGVGKAAGQTMIKRGTTTIITRPVDIITPGR
jgi:hypothetical protein